MAYKSNSNKFWTGFLAVLLVLVIAGTAALVGVLSDGFKNWDKFKTDEEQQEQTEETADNGAPVTDENGDELSSDAAIPMPKAMTFRSAAALDGRNAVYDSVTVNATVEPVGVELKSFVYTVEWVNPESAWATGKTVTDYFTVTQATENSLQATLQCLQPFGEQIKVIGTGTSLDDITASAECVIDFARRVIGASVSLKGDGGSAVDTLSFADGSYTFSSDDLYLFFGKDEISLSYSDYTVEDYDFVDLSIAGTDEMLAKLQAGGFSSAFAIDNEISSGSNLMIMSGSMMFNGFYGAGALFNIGASDATSVNNAVAVVRENVSIPFATITLTVTGVYSEVSYSVDIYTTVDRLVTSIESVSLDQSNVII